MKTSLFTKRFVLCVLLFYSSVQLLAQPAAVSVPVSIGRTTCGSGTRGVQEFNYNGTTNVLGNLGAICVPSLGTPGFSTSLTGNAFNPKDSSMYIVRTIYSGGVPTTYVWKYRMPGCPTGSLARSNTFVGWDIAGLVFDRDGNGFWLEFQGATAPYTIGLRRVDFATNTIGAFDTISTSSSLGTFQMWNLNGDLALTPKGVMFASFDDKLFTVDYTQYGQPGFISSTYIDTVRRPAGGSMVGLCYADGKLLASYNNCLYREINPLTGDTSVVTYSGGVVSYDLASITSSLGIAKDLVSALPTGTPNQYDLDYNIKISNLGNVPLDNIQVVENLAAVFGPANVSVTSVSFVQNPGTLFLNAGFTGVGNNNLFSNTPSVSRLRNYPTSQSTAIISVKCRVSNIIPGVTYNNNVTGTANGYRNVALSDVSTDGTRPDLNDNDKSDDPGESQPTPFIINVAPELPPCDSLNSVIYSQDFGTGVGIVSGMPGTARTQYTAFGGTIPVPDERYAITNNANTGNPTRWVSLTDHTGNPNGRMMVVNADNLGARIFFDSINVSCDRFKYSFFAWVAFLGNSNYQTFCNGVGGYKYSKLTFMVRNASNGRIITSSTTSDITSNAWGRYGIKWVMPAGVTRVVLEIYNSGDGGCGNDLALDDIQYGLCDVLPTVATSGTDGCLGGSTTFDVTLTDTVGMTSFLTYQWQFSNDGVSGWTNIGGATSVNYTINPVLPLHQRYYRVIVSNGNPSCQFISNGALLSVRTPSLAALSASRSKNNICPGEAVNLRVNGGLLGTGAAWRWYSGSCGGTLVGTGSSITVNPTVTTTYYVLAQGDCNTTTCVPVTVNINCDIDDDDDGIPDITENNGVDVEGDDDFDGIVNWRDVGMAGFIDTNGDGVDDRYDFDLDGIINQYDRDSDNDGIPDVVESYGIDADGNGIIDNYSDTDADGFSQNVDANTSGHLVSGNGLGRLDLDGDGQPNFMDLDSDNDGIPDIREVLRADTDNNGRVDGAWLDPDNDGYHSAIDADADGNGTSENSANALLRNSGDADNNGRADNWPNKNNDRDGRANPYDLDSDGDGLADVYEMRYGQIRQFGSSSFADANNDGFADGTIGANGYNTTLDALPAINMPNNDSDIYFDVYDIDADGDGITDNIEILTSFQPGANYVLPSGSDPDLDGLDNAYDNNPAAFGGNAIVPVDTDSDGTPDYLDLDTDSDGQPDIIEGNDFNFNRIVDDFITPAGADTDGDGLDNTFDFDNSNPYVTSNQMGAGGSFTGPGAYGTNSVVTRSYAFQYDRDWRFNGMILDVNIISFTGNLNNGTAHLNWTLVANKAISKMVVERSLNGSTFETIAELPGTNNTGRLLGFSYNDNVQAIVAARYYYRIKITGVDNRTKTTNIIMLSALRNSNTGIEVAPVPARNNFNLTVRTTVAGPAQVELVDMAGKLVYRQEHRMMTGANVISFSNAQQFGQGVFQVRVRMGGEVLHARLIIE